MTEDRVPHPECIEAYHGRLLLTGRTIMSVSRVRGLVAASEQPAPPLDVERQRDEAHVQCLNDREEACRLLVGMLDAFDNRWTGEKPPPQTYYRAQRFLNRMLPERLARND